MRTAREVWAEPSFAEEAAFTESDHSFIFFRRVNTDWPQLSRGPSLSHLEMTDFLVISTMLCLDPQCF